MSYRVQLPDGVIINDPKLVLRPEAPPQLTLVAGAGAVGSTDADGSGVTPPGLAVSDSKDTPRRKAELDATDATILPPPGRAWTSGSAAKEPSAGGRKSTTARAESLHDIVRRGLLALAAAGRRGLCGRSS